MDLNRQLDNFQKEHAEILHFLLDFEIALALAEAESDEDRRAGLAQLREIEDKLIGIREHCRQEEQSIESPFQLYLENFALEDLHREHDQLDRQNNDFCAELSAVTAPPPTGTLVRLGRRLIENLRHHIAREEWLLKQIRDGSAAEEKHFLRYTQPGE